MFPNDIFEQPLGYYISFKHDVYNISGFKSWLYNSDDDIMLVIKYLSKKNWSGDAAAQYETRTGKVLRIQ